jgi:hypothetical protein
MRRRGFNMTTPCLCDAVTLRHFAAINRLEVLAARCRYLDPPHWTQAVFDEIREAAQLGQPGCRAVLKASWLLTPIAPEYGDLKEIVRLQIGLNDGRRPPTGHAGEAEGIYFAAKLGGRFVTDDNGAYDFAVHRLGSGRVQDTVDLLREAVTYGDLDAGGALDIVNAVRDSGRSIRRVHPNKLWRDYFN